MKLLKVEIKNFKSYKEQVFEMPGPGFYYFTGVNEADPRATTNGIGKSTLMDAIYWCLYEKTAQGDKAGDLLNYGPGVKGGYSVKLTFDTCVIERTWKPNSFKIDGVEVKNEALFKVLNLTEDQFLRSVYFAQDGDYFLDMTPGKKLEFLSNIFQLDEWIRLSELAKSDAAAKRTEITVSEGSLVNSKQQIKAQAANQLDLKTKSEGWAGEIASEIQTLESSLKDFESKVLPTPPIDTLNQQIADLNLKIQALNILENEVRSEESTLKQNIAVAKSWSDSYSATIDQWLDPENTEDPICDKCGQTVPMSHIEKQAEDVTAQIAAKEAEILGWESELNELIAKKSTEIEMPRTEYQTQLDTLNLELLTARQEISAQQVIEHNIQSLQAQIASKRAATNPFDELIEKSKSQVEALETNVTALTAKIDKLGKELTMLEGWEKHFKLIRLWVLSSAIEQLQIAFNQSLSDLGFDTWEIQLENQRELKSKDEARKELHFRVFREGKEKGYKGLSGGEKGRLRLASTLGISDLILGMEDCDPGFRIFDETGTGLSEEGVSDLLASLANLGEFKTVLFADHRIFERAQFTGVYRIIKNVDGHSSIAAA